MFDYIPGYKLLVWLKGCWDTAFCTAAAHCASEEVTGHEGMEVKKGQIQTKKTESPAAASVCILMRSLLAE